MKLVGLMPVRNEDWILGLSARVALQWCDQLVFGLHACTDQSEKIVHAIQDEHPYQVSFIKHADSAWNEMQHRQELLEVARGWDATHIAMVDADEILTANLCSGLCPVKEWIRALEPGQMLELPGYNLRRRLTQYHSNGIWGQRWFAVAFKDCPEASWQGDQFHHREPFGVQWRRIKTVSQGQGGVMHLWGASERRLTAKHALYKVTERLRYPDKPVIDIELMYNLWRSPADVRKWNNYPQGTWEYAVTADGWWNFQNRQQMPLPDYEGVPWQEAEVKRLVEEHGRHTFAGLDLFGVA